jgi:hypothetical protein
MFSFLPNLRKLLIKLIQETNLERLLTNKISCGVSICYLLISLPLLAAPSSRVTRFFSVKYTKIGKKYTKLQQNIPNGHTIYQTAVK